MLIALTLQQLLYVCLTEEGLRWVCGRSPDEIVVSNPAGGRDVCLS